MKLFPLFPFLKGKWWEETTPRHFGNPPSQLGTGRRQMTIEKGLEAPHVFRMGRQKTEDGEGTPFPMGDGKR